jgi:hypothetical protein
MSDDSDSGELSTEERELIALQTEMLRESRNAAAQGQELNHLLTPILLEEAGYDVTLSQQDVINPAWQRAQDDVRRLREKLQAKGERYGGLDLINTSAADLAKGGLDGGGEGLGDEDVAAIASLQAQFTSAKARRDQIEKGPGGRYLNREGDVIGVTKAPDTDAERIRKENELLLLNRQGAALRGELPVNPALMSSLEEQEEELRAALEKNLGPGYETSTPGIEALAEFEQKKQGVMEAARRDDIGFAQGLANDMGGFIAGMDDRGTNQTNNILGNQFGEATNLAQISQAFSGPIGYNQQERMAGDTLSGGQQAGLAAIGYGAQTGNPYVAGAGALAYLFLD